MKESAQVLGFPCDSDVLSAALPPDPGSEPLRLRLTLSRQGEVDLTSAPLAQNPPEWRVAIAPSRVVSADPRLAHKTTDRAFYDDARTASGADEVVLVRPDGLVTEGSITAIFVPRGDVLLTPRLESGLLDSVLRRELVDSGRAVPYDLTAADLADGFLLGNSLRGLVEARLVQP